MERRIGDKVKEIDEKLFKIYSSRYIYISLQLYRLFCMYSIAVVLILWVDRG